MSAPSEQETFWRGGFGDEYSERCRGDLPIASNSALFGTILRRTDGVGSVLELGANIGLNLAALANLLPDAEFSAVEINARAAAELRSNIPHLDVHEMSIHDFRPVRTWDLVFTKGVLIHINPEQLDAVYELLNRCATRYILVAEYYSPVPVEVTYRGHGDRLFKRDFAGEILDRYPDLTLVDYGFVYHRDPCFPQDDMNWFLLKKP